MSDVEARRVRMGFLGTGIVLILLVVVMLGSTVLPRLSGSSYSAYFSEAGGLASGDEVVASGLAVGKVRGVELDGNRVKISFAVTDGDVRLGRETTAAIITRTVLGRRALEIRPAGPGELNRPIPLARTTPPYDVTQALADVTRSAQQIDQAGLGKALELTGGLLADVAPDVRPALSGINRLSGVVAGRDAELRSLLASTSKVTQVLADRDLQIQQLIGQGASLLSRVDARRTALEGLIENAGRVTTEVAGLMKDNRRELKPSLTALNQVLAKLNANKENIAHGLRSAGPLMRELGEVVSAFPGFNVYIPNLIATDLVPTLPQLFGVGNPS